MSDMLINLRQRVGSRGLGQAMPPLQRPAPDHFQISRDYLRIGSATGKGGILSKTKRVHEEISLAMEFRPLMIPASMPE
jgi:hypothetical protein